MRITNDQLMVLLLEAARHSFNQSGEGFNAEYHTDENKVNEVIEQTARDVFKNRHSILKRSAASAH